MADAERDESPDLDLAAATLQANAGDVRMLLRLLVNQLAGALGEQLTVERAGGVFRRSDEVRAVEARVGGDVLRAQLDHGGLRCTADHYSGGIRIRSEPLSVDAWVRRLLGAVQVEADRSEAARLALERIVLGEP